MQTKKTLRKIISIFFATLGICLLSTNKPVIEQSEATVPAPTTLRTEVKNSVSLEEQSEYVVGENTVVNLNYHITHLQHNGTSKYINYATVWPYKYSNYFVVGYDIELAHTENATEVIEITHSKDFTAESFGWGEFTETDNYEISVPLMFSSSVTTDSLISEGCSNHFCFDEVAHGYGGIYTPYDTYSIFKFDDKPNLYYFVGTDTSILSIFLDSLRNENIYQEGYDKGKELGYNEGNPDAYKNADSSGSDISNLFFGITLLGILSGAIIITISVIIIKKIRIN